MANSDNLYYTGLVGQVIKFQLVQILHKHDYEYKLSDQDITIQIILLQYLML